MSSNDLPQSTAHPERKRKSTWIWLVLALIILAAVIAISINNANQRRAAQVSSQSATATALAVTAPPTPAADLEEAFGNISFGWGGYRPLTCVVSRETTAFPLAELNNAEFIFFVSPFAPAETGEFIKWKITRPDGTLAYDMQSKIWPDSDLCFWQGFVLAEEEPGVYALEITDWKGVVSTINFSIE